MMKALSKLINDEPPIKVCTKCIICEGTIEIPDGFKIDTRICPKCIKKLRKLINEVADDE